MAEFALGLTRTAVEGTVSRVKLAIDEETSVVEWDAIRMYLPDTNNGSRIVVSTPHLGLALSCTGNPYQVTELGHFSHGQSLCAFFNKVPGRRSDTGELIWQLRFHGVISVWNGSHEQTALVKKLYNCVTHKSKEFDGVQFDRHSWIDVPSPFDMDVFARCLFLNFHSDDLRAKKITEVGTMGNKAIIQRCCRFLREDNCLLIINGLQSTGEWESIEETFLTEPTKSCIIVSRNYERVANYRAEEEERELNIEDLEADVVLSHSIKGCEYCGIGGKEASSRGRFFSNRKEEARDWTKKFKHVVPENGLFYHFLRYLQNPGVIFLCGIDDAEKSSVARRIYYELIDGQEKIGFGFTIFEKNDFGFTKYSWAEVPHPFNLTDLCWRLLLDFYSDDLKAKETATVGLIEGRQDPVEGCRKFLRQDKCFIVIRGLHSSSDWSLIRDALLSEPTKGCILVITNDASVATHQQGQVINFQGPEADIANLPSIKKKGRVFSSGMVEARDWITEFELIGHHREWGLLCSKLMTSSPLVLSVWGIAGVGKSALVKIIYYTSMMGFKHSHLNFGYGSSGYLGQVKKYGWVDVPHPFSLINLARRLLLDFHSDDLEARETEAAGMMEGQDPIQRCCKFMREEKCFVVIDGLRSTDDWDLIKTAFLSDRIKSCILVITNEEAVATHCVDQENQMINVKGLEAEAALNLFTKIAWGAVKKLSTEEREFSEAILAKCGGLPKVIAAIGEYASKRIASKNKTLASISTKIHRDFIGKLETDSRFHCLRGLFCWMQSYFDACSDSLKPCIFYLSMFQNIRRRRMLRRWIAEGYSTDKSASGTAKDNGELLFGKLVESSIIQQQQTPSSSISSSSSKMVYQVNGFFREYIISRPMEDNLVFALEGHCSPDTQRTGQHLAIMCSWDRDQIVFESMDFTRLRSLTVFGEWRSFFISTDTKMRLLRVLDLEDTKSGVTDEVLEKIVKLLPRLKFLSIRGCQDITRLPDSLGGLRQLQTLDIRHTKIRMLPYAIIKLVKLQYLRAGTTHESLAHGDDCSSIYCRTPASREDANQPAADRDGEGTSQPTAGDEDSSNGVSTSQPAEAVEDDVGSTSQPAAAGDVASTSQPAADKVRTWIRVAPWRRAVRDLVVSCRKKLRRRPRHDDGIVEIVPAAARGIGKLTALHTLGVVHVSSSAGGKTFLLELKKLTQLHKLRVSGINRKNWLDLCSAISGHHHLKSLSVRFYKAAAATSLFSGPDDLFSDLPKTLKSLKLYAGDGNVQVSPVLLKRLGNLRKYNFELTASTQLDIDSLVEIPCIFRHLYVKPIQDGKLCYAPWTQDGLAGRFFGVRVLEIDCGSYRSEIFLGDLVSLAVQVLVVHCSSITTESSLKLSALDSHDYAWDLQEVWLKGSYSEAVKQHFQQELAKLPWLIVEPVLKLDGEQTHQSPDQSNRPAASSAC